MKKICNRCKKVKKSNEKFYSCINNNENPYVNGDGCQNILCKDCSNKFEDCLNCQEWALEYIRNSYEEEKNNILQNSILENNKE